MTEYRKARMAPIPSTRLFHKEPTLNCSLSGQGRCLIVCGPSARLRNGVVAVTTPGVAAADPAHRQPRVPHGTLCLEGVQAVGRAGGDVTAGRKAGAKLSRPAVETDA